MAKAIVVSEAGGIYSVRVNLGLSSVVLRCKSYSHACGLVAVLEEALDSNEPRPLGELLDAEFGPKSEA